MDTKKIVKLVSYGVSTVALISLVTVAPVQVLVLVASAGANIFYVNK